MMRRLVFAAVLLLVAACSGQQTTAEPASSRTATTEPTPSTRNIITEGIHDKRVGQPGGFGCGDGPDAVCDVTVTVTAVELNPPCAVAPPSGMRLLRIEVDAQAPLAFQYEPPATALMLSHWAIETADGKMQYDLRMVDACSPDPGVFVGPLVPATHRRDSVVVIAPTAATWLWMEYEKTAYRWPVRPPV
jgi:hypothetical protein